MRLRPSPCLGNLNHELQQYPALHYAYGVPWLGEEDGADVEVGYESVG